MEKPSTKESTATQTKAEKIQALHKAYEADLRVLKQKQTNTINQFVRGLEEKKIEEIRKSLN